VVSEHINPTGCEASIFFLLSDKNKEGEASILSAKTQRG